MKLQAYSQQSKHNDRIPKLKLKPQSLFIATTILVGFLYSLCALFVAVSPQSTMAFLSYVSHLDLVAIAQPITWDAFFVGLVFYALGTGLLVAFIGYYYNRIATK